MLKFQILNPCTIVIIPIIIIVSTINNMRQVHQDEEANVEMSNFEPLDMPPSQTGLNVSGVQVLIKILKSHDFVVIFHLNFTMVLY